MKGITPVVAVILLLLIVIALVAFSSVFFQRVATTGTQAGEEQLTRLAVSTGKAVKVDNAGTASLTVRNTGTQAVALATEVAIYVNNAPVACTWSAAVLNAGETATCTAGYSCVAGQTVKVTSPAGDDVLLCR